MAKKYIDVLMKNTERLDAQETLRYIYEKFKDKVVIASSLGAEDQVITDMAIKVSKKFKIFTLDTGRLPQETYDLIEETNKRYGIKIRIYFPDKKEVEKMINEYGPNLFYESIEKRKLCCQIRKVNVLEKILKNYDVWITGLRQEQSITRQNINKIEFDEKFNIIKVNPIFDWKTQDVWDYIKKHNVPYNKLHDKNYPSIGCAPCTRAINKGEDIRSGRWWWEQPEQKECGIHIKDGKVIRISKEGK
jgi:phosphoadenosine phosphosulfate reductase